MKASSGSSNSSRASTSTDRPHPAASAAAPATPASVADLDDAAATSKTSAALQCREALLSSPDTDDGDASYSKLVIDLDASGGVCGAAAESGAADCKQTTSNTSSSSFSASETTLAMSSMSSASSSSSSRLDASTKSSRTQQSISSSSAVDGVTAKASSAAPTSHRLSKPHSAELSNGGAQKGLKMKIRCSQSGGGGQPPRHEVSHFHPVVGSPHTSASSGCQASHGSKSAAGGVGRSSSSHRRDKQLMKDRTSTTAKDRTTDKHLPPGGAASDVTGSGSSVALSVSSAVVIVSRDVALEATKSLNVDTNADRDVSSSAAHAPAAVHDPYEFNASCEDSISCPAKKMKFDQVCGALI